jgi:hypothetical protein
LERDPRTTLDAEWVSTTSLKVVAKKNIPVPDGNKLLANHPASYFTASVTMTDVTKFESQ